MHAGHGVEPVELAVPSQVESGHAELDRRSDVPGPADAPREIIETVLVAMAVEAVDAGCTLPACRRGEAGAVRNGRSRSVCAAETERTRFTSCRISGEGLGHAVHRDHSADSIGSPQSGLRSANHF